MKMLGMTSEHCKELVDHLKVTLMQLPGPRLAFLRPMSTIPRHVGECLLILCEPARVGVQRLGIEPVVTCLS